MRALAVDQRRSRRGDRARSSAPRTPTRTSTYVDADPARAPAGRRMLLVSSPYHMRRATDGLAQGRAGRDGHPDAAAAEPVLRPHAAAPRSSRSAASCRNTSPSSPTGGAAGCESCAAGASCSSITLPAMAVAVLVVAARVEVWVGHLGTRGAGPGFSSPTPRAGSGSPPNYDGWFAGVPVHINSLGLRDAREYDLAKPPNTFRILVLGDSVTFGHGSVSEHTYPFLLEQRLKAWRPDVDWQVWNAAVPGYNTSQELAHLLEVGPRFQPDLVIVGFFENDLIDNRPVGSPGVMSSGAGATAVVRCAVTSIRSSCTRRCISPAVASVEIGRVPPARWSIWAPRKRCSPTSRMPARCRSSADAVRAAHGRAGAGRQLRLRHEAEPRDRSRRSSASRGFSAWVDAVRGFQQLNATGAYRVVFFLNRHAAGVSRWRRLLRRRTESIDRLLSARDVGDGTPAVSSLRRVPPRAAVADAERRGTLDRQRERRESRRAVRVPARQVGPLLP